MKSFVRGMLACAVIALGGNDAFAQGTYVSGSLIGDIVRSSHAEGPGTLDNSGGEALGFALRLGTPLGSNWGVEAEFARPSAIEHAIDDGSLAAWSPGGYAISSLTYTPVTFSDPFALPSSLPTSIRSFGSSSERTTTMSASLWVQQQLSGRVAMMYLAGMGFYRSEYKYRFVYEPLLPDFPGLPALTLPAFDTTSISYGVRPLAGIESRISMTEHVQLVPGVRLHGAENGWLIRPSVGLAWTF